MYSYGREFCFTLLWAGLLLSPCLLLLRWRRKPLRYLSPVLAAYLLLLSWVKAASSETYTARQVIGYQTVTRYTDELDILDDRKVFVCQEPLYAHEGRDSLLLLVGPLLIAAALFGYDLRHGTRYGRQVLACYLPFLLLGYVFALEHPPAKPCKTASGVTLP